MLYLSVAILAEATGTVFVNLSKKAIPILNQSAVSYVSKSDSVKRRRWCLKADNLVLVEIILYGRRIQYGGVMTASRS
ncbi:hypothetical protein BH24ACT19_BH24ACT19_16260 [soil metagenome]|jgi:hypothetical protein